MSSESPTTPPGPERAYDRLHRRNVELQARVEAAEARAVRLQILADRAYPGLEPSGYCSALHNPGQDAYTCTVCYPDLRALIAAHNDLKQKAWAQRDRAVEALATLREAVASALTSG